MTMRHQSPHHPHCVTVDQSRRTSPAMDQGIETPSWKTRHWKWILEYNLIYIPRHTVRWRGQCSWSSRQVKKERLALPHELEVPIAGAQNTEKQRRQMRRAMWVFSRSTDFVLKTGLAHKRPCSWVKKGPWQKEVGADEQNYNSYWETSSMDEERRLEKRPWSKKWLRIKWIGPDDWLSAKDGMGKRYLKIKWGRQKGIIKGDPWP